MTWTFTAFAILVILIGLFLADTFITVKRWNDHQREMYGKVQDPLYSGFTWMIPMFEGILLAAATIIMYQEYEQPFS